MVQRLSGLDATFLYVETDSMPMHVALAAILDPSTMVGGYSFEALQAFLGSRVPLVPPLHRRVETVPFGAGHPIWVDDPDWSLDHHIRRAVLDPPGSYRQLAHFVSEMASERLDRDRPLWQFWIVEGLEDGRIAFTGKVHHCALDGGAAADLMPAFFGIDPEPGPVDAPDVDPAVRPDDLELVAGALAERVRDAAGAVGALGRLGRAAAAIRTRRRESSGTGATPLTGPATPYNGPITSARAIAFARLPLDAVKRVRRASATTVNDVVLACCAGALRGHLLEVDELPEQPLVFAVPVSIRPSDERGTGNRLSVMFVPLHTELSDPAERLRATALDTAAAKQEQSIVGTDTMSRLTQALDPMLVPWVMGVYSAADLAGRHRPAVNGVVSNVVGPPIPIYLGGARAEALYPMGPVIEGMGLNLTVMSYEDHVDVGVLAAEVLVPDPWSIADRMRPALDELIAAVTGQTADVEA